MFSIQVWTHMELYGFKHYYPFPFRTLQFFLEFKSFSLCFALQVSVTLIPASFDFILFGLVRRLVCRVRLWPNYLTAAASVVVCHLLLCSSWSHKNVGGGDDDADGGGDYKLDHGDHRSWGLHFWKQNWHQLDQIRPHYQDHRILPTP